MRRRHDVGAEEAEREETTQGMFSRQIGHYPLRPYPRSDGGLLSNADYARLLEKPEWQRTCVVACDLPVF